MRAEMHQPAVDLIRRGIEAFNRQDLDGMLEQLDAAVELVPMRSLVEGGAYRGHDGVRRYLEDMTRDWQDFEIEIAALRELGDDRVIVDAVMRAHTLGTGIEVDARGAWLCEVRDGKVVRITFYRDAESALDAASPQTD